MVSLRKISDAVISDPNFLNKLIIQHTVHSEAEMMQLAQDIALTDLQGGYDELPAWRIHRFENTNGVSGLYMRIHHVIGDGMSMVGAMSQAFKEEDGSNVKLDFIPIKATSGDGNANNINPTKSEHEAMKKVIGAFFEVLLLPLSSFDADIKFTSPNKSTLTMTGQRKVVYLPCLKLDIVKKIKSKAGVTLNDVMLSITSGAIGRYCAHMKDPLVNSETMLQNRALVPFAFPRSKEMTNDQTNGMCNYWAFLSIPLPIVLGSKNTTSEVPLSVQRLRTCNSSTKQLKSSPLAYVALWIQNNLLPLVPSFLAQKTALDLFQRHTIVFSNVPGPTRPVSFCNERVLAIQAIFPNLLPQVILISYCDAIFANMVLDEKLVTHPELLSKYYVEEVMELCKHYNISFAPEGVKPTPEMLLSKRSAHGGFGVIDVSKFDTR